MRPLPAVAAVAVLLWSACAAADPFTDLPGGVQLLDARSAAFQLVSDRSPAGVVVLMALGLAALVIHRLRDGA